MGKLNTIIYSAQDWNNLTDEERATLEKELLKYKMTLTEYERQIKRLFPKEVTLPTGRIKK